MDVELQILKHLARDAHPTVAIIDEYCAEYKDLFKEVRNYECFKYLHVGIIAPLKRKSLPEIAKVVSINSAQSLHHFIANSDWSVEQLRSCRLNKIKKALKGNAITVVIDETGDRKKGKTTEYVARLYLGSIRKIDNGIVSVNAYGVYCNITFPLIVKVFKPKGTLKSEDKYQTKIELAAEIITELINEGFNIKLVLADSLSGESSQFLSKLAESNLGYVVAIRSNHAVWLPASQRVRANKWYASRLKSGNPFGFAVACGGASPEGGFPSVGDWRRKPSCSAVSPPTVLARKFERTFSNQKLETRYIREIVYGKKRAITYWEITTDPETMPENSTTFVMTNL